MSDPHVIPAERLYWGVIDTSGFPPLAFAMLRPEAVRCRYANQLDAVLPIAVEELHVVYHPIGEHAVLACGIEHARIAELRDAGTSRVAPATIPGLPANTEYPTPESLNLLTGAYLPTSVVKSRRAQSRWIAAGFLLIATLVSIGNLRRGQRHGAVAETLRARQTELYQSVLGTEPNSLPLSVRLTTELRRLSATRGTGGAVADSTDAVLDLESVFRVWPSDTRLRVERLSVSSDRIDIAAEADATLDFERFISATQDLPGWDLKQRRIDQGQGDQPSRARLGFDRDRDPNTDEGGRS
jgi:type II secretory pathway component PulL